MGQSRTQMSVLLRSNCTRRPLFCDGRQPRQQSRQQVLGIRPFRINQGKGLYHLLVMAKLEEIPSFSKITPEPFLLCPFALPLSFHLRIPSMIGSVDTPNMRKSQGFKPTEWEAFGHNLYIIDFIKLCRLTYESRSSQSSDVLKLNQKGRRTCVQ